MESSQGSRLAVSILGAFDAMVGEVVEVLAAHGHPGVTPALEFALTAIDDGATTAAELARAIGVSRQAAAKTVHALEALGYLERADDPADRRRQALHVSARGIEMAGLGRAAFDDIRSRLVDRVGPAQVAQFESTLEAIRLLVAREPD